MKTDDIKIPAEQFQELLRLYNEFHTAIEPTDPAVVTAEQAFHRLLRTLHEAHAHSIPFTEFRRFTVRQCVLYLRKN